MQVILLNGIWRGNPLPMRSIGSYKVAHTLRKAGISVKVVDFIDMLTGDELITLLQQLITDDTVWIGFSSTFMAETTEIPVTRPDGTTAILRRQRRAGINAEIDKAFGILKETYPTIKRVIGGVMVDSLSATDLKNFDYGFAGYAEGHAVNLHNFITDNLPQPTMKEYVPGFFLLDWPGLNAPYDIQTDDFTWHDDDNIQPGETLPLETARGCIFKCKFCSYPEIGKKKGEAVRRFAHVEHEIRRNYEKWGITRYFMLDDTFNDDPDKVKEFRDMALTLPFKLEFSAYIRVDLVWSRPETAEWLKEAGLKAAFFGIESMHPAASKIIGKGWSGGPHAKPFIEKLRNEIWKDDVSIFLSYIIGLTPETKSSVLESFHWSKRINIHSASFKALFIRDIGKTGKYVSEFETDAAKYGYQVINIVTPNDPVPRWLNSNTTDLSSRIDCAKLERELTNARRSLNRLNEWTLLAFGTLGYEISQVAKVYETDREFYKESYARARAWRNTYFTKLLDSVTYNIDSAVR
jgi:radical SAM superfamily enzyme YgiQ (UPF0313 family)